MARKKNQLDDVFELDFREIIPRVCAELKLKQCPRLVTVLNTLKIDGRRFRFVYDEYGAHRIYVKCPQCQNKKLKLLKLEAEYACSECHCAKKKKKSRSLLYSRYVRPLKKLAEIEKRLFTENLTIRQRQTLEKKAAKLMKVVPEFIYQIREKVLATASSELK